MVACSGCLREAGSVNYSVNWTPLPIESSRVFSGLFWGLIVTEHRDLDSLENRQTKGCCLSSPLSPFKVM